MFHGLLALGIVAAALIGIYFSYRRGDRVHQRRQRFRLQGPSVAPNLLDVAADRLDNARCYFPPVVSRYGYSTMFFVFASFLVICFITAAVFLPETKGKTREEIEEYF